MTSFVAIDHFTKTELTAIPPEEKPTYNSLKILHQELNANAMAVPSTGGGGNYGHLALALTPAQFNALPNTIPWVLPAHPGVAPVHAGNATQAQITETNRLYIASETRFFVCRATETALRKQLLDAIPDTFTKALKHEMYGYAQLTVIQVLTHLDTTYGTVDAFDLAHNLKRMNATWSPSQPIENLWNQIKDAQKFAADHDPITDQYAVRSALENLENSGMFTDSLRDWRKLTIAAQQSFATMETHFTAADKERRRILTSKGMGYANKATEAKSNKDPPASTKGDKNGVPMYYCWSHGLGPNGNHTSASCSKPVTGHRKDSTADNMLGGGCQIHRKAGERAIYRRPQRPNRDNDENQPPADPAQG
ncbi:hypothetical protein SEMRO_474_G150160.1 [Seminavis robusta]|uniref:Uncharacterized protein n=1 Tax=Seminavis robusta TaxID=568900 RepID=A0A9N8DZE0_9STRA|nr:hypothetical protein SEMRO_474_G150160.1 [Seminavis robusta]|eukprot:Sro474_g150160.1 n/a (365) ;mRNA; r:1365-2459